MSEKHYRAALIPYLVPAITSAKSAQTTVFASPPCQLFALDWYEVDGMRIKVILKKKGNGGVHFWSIMARRTKKPRLFT